MSRLQALYLFIVIRTYHCFVNNTWETLIGPEGEYIWRSTSDFIPLQSKSYGTIKIGQQMNMEFDFYFNGRSNEPRQYFEENFFRVGHAGVNGGCEEGSRYPSMWLASGRSTTGIFDVSVSAGSQCDLSHEITAYGNISIGSWMHIKISIDWTTITFSLSDDNGNYTESWERSTITNRVHLGQDLPVWFMSDKPSGSDYNIGDGRFRNISIISTVFTYSPTSVTLAPSATTSGPTIWTSNPTKSPTFGPSFTPTKYPTNDPTLFPTKNPTLSPTKYPTLSPTTFPTLSPSNNPTLFPSNYPTLFPSNYPTVSPTLNPSTAPTLAPTSNPSLNPTFNPTFYPTTAPTVDPTTEPTFNPSLSPTKHPTIEPTTVPTVAPTSDPSSAPIINPTNVPTSDPSYTPTHDPTADPVAEPTYIPTMNPSFDPTLNPILSPSAAPTSYKPTVESIISTLSPSDAISTKAPSQDPTHVPTDYTILHTEVVVMHSTEEELEKPSEPMNYLHIIAIVSGIVALGCLVLCCQCCYGYRQMKFGGDKQIHTRIASDEAQLDQMQMTRKKGGSFDIHKLTPP